MPNERLEVLTWVLIFGGLLVLGLGIALLQRGAAWGWIVIAGGALAAAVGAALIWVRARREGPAPPGGR